MGIDPRRVLHIGVLMSVSTIVVALNAQLLRRLDLRPVPLERA